MAESGASRIPKYQYQPLQNPKSLRFLRLQPGSKTAHDIICELIEVPPEKLDEKLNEKPISYEAVSWTWGTEKWTKSIRINKNDQAFSFDISPTLASALMALRLPADVRVLWIDAICIDQKNGFEKNQQVPMMAEIYGKAKEVCIWLGDATEGDAGTKVALDFIKKEVLMLWEFDQLCENLEKSKKWAALIGLMKRPWFSRRWVVQEIALANKGTLYCGSEKIDWQDFADAVSLFVQVETATHRLSEVMKKSEVFHHVPDFFGEIPALGASLLVEATSNLFRRSKEGTREPLLSLEYLVSTLSVFEATDHRDTVFALLAIAKDTSPRAAHQQETDATIPAHKQLSAWSNKIVSKTYHVDYEQPIVEIYKEFVAFSIRQADQTRALDIICKPWAPPLDNGDQRVVHGWEPFSQAEDNKVGGDEAGDNKTENSKTHKLPSWIASLNRAAYGMIETTTGAGHKMTRMNADPLVGLPGERNYTAAGTRKVNRSALKIKKRATYYSMYVEGFILDKIGDIQEVARHGNIPEPWLEFGGWDHREEDPPQEFWRTVIANRGSQGRNAPSFYPRACKESIRKGMKGGALDGADLIHTGRCSIVAEFLRRLRAVIWNRRLMRTMTPSKPGGTGRLGLVPENACKEDLICILYGCSVPVVLRPIPLNPGRIADEREAHYQEDFLEATIALQRGWRHIKKRRAERAETAKKAERARSTPKNIRIKCYEQGLQSIRVYQRFAGSITSVCIALYIKYWRHVNLERDLVGEIIGFTLILAVLPWPIRRLWVAALRIWRTASSYWTKKPRRRLPLDQFYYEVIGDCYVHGMMDGEAIAFQNDEGTRPQIFELR